jgi:hypothetical protein
MSIETRISRLMKKGSQKISLSVPLMFFLVSLYEIQICYFLPVID